MCGVSPKDREPGREDAGDGLALWEEHRPQSASDWVGVAERFIAADGDVSKSSPLFAALVSVVRERAGWQQEWRAVGKLNELDPYRDDWEPDRGFAERVAQVWLKHNQFDETWLETRTVSPPRKEDTDA